MNCKTCNAEVAESTRFCPACGTATAANTATGNEVATKSEEDKKNEMIGGVVGVLIFCAWWFWSSASSGMDIDVSYCEHKIQDCKWNENASTMADCTFTNEADVSTRLFNFKTWSYSSSGVLLSNSAIGAGSVSPGRSVQVTLLFDKNTDRAYVCSMDPESEMGQALVTDLLTPLEIT